MAPSKQRTALSKKGKVSSRKREHVARMVAARLTKVAVTSATPSTLTPVSDATPEEPSTPEPEPSAPTSGPSTPPHQPMEPSQPPLSASHRKLSLFKNGMPQTSADLPTTIVDLNVVASLFQTLLCPGCLSPNLVLQTDRSRSFAIHLQVFCTLCGDVQSEDYTSGGTSTDSTMEVNRKVVAAGLATGMGHASLMTFSELTGMPSMHRKTYDHHLNTISQQVPAVSTSFLTQARTKVRDYYREHERDAFDGEGLLNVPVAFDGTWGTRGHTAKMGCAAVIEIMTGLVIDYHVMSLYCQTCATTGQKMKEKGEGVYDRWWRAHVNKCQRNYEGSSGGMEVCAAKVLWQRSLDHGMRYTTLVGDGDTKTYSAVTSLNPYGDEWPVRKEECVNHVSKRLNTALRNLVSTCNKQSVRLGGNTKGSLTQAKIGLLQSYYTKAVRTYNSSVEAMSKAIWAAYFHSISTDERPQHDDCPPGAESWCRYQRALATGEPVSTNGGKPQSTFLNSKVAEYVRPVYERLTSPDLLSRCLLGTTQNVNESLHSLIWARCHKHRFAGLKRVQIATLLAVGEYNMGSTASHQFLRAVGCRVGNSSLEMGSGRDTRRLSQAERQQQEVEKRRREKRKTAQQKEQSAAERAEGGPLYVAGGF